MNLKKCLRAIDVCNGVVRAVSDEEICNAKAVIGKYGLGCEPATAASVAGLKLLRDEGVIGADEQSRVCAYGACTEGPECYGELSQGKTGAVQQPAD